MSTTYRTWAAVTPGFEDMLAAEVAELLPDAKPKARAGGVEVVVPREGLWRLAVFSRLTEHLRARVGRFEARTFEQLEAGLRKLPWAAYVKRGTVPPVRATCKKSALYHSGAVEERVVGLLKHLAGGRWEETAGPMLHVRLFRDTVTVTADASGEPLHRRGWRPSAGDAPLRETLAAACVRAARLPADRGLWDPFCGAGTVVIEAAAARAGLPAAVGRGFAFEMWPTHDPDAWAAYVEGLPSGVAAGPVLVGSDLDGRAVALAVRNALSAGVGEAARFLTGDFAAAVAEVPKGTAVLTNPPWGKRQGSSSRVRETWSRFGEVLASRPDLSPVLVLSGGRDFARSTGLPWEVALTFSDRGTPVELLRLAGR